MRTTTATIDDDEDDADSDSSFLHYCQVCDDCKHQLKKAKNPKVYIGAGYDFGSARRIGLAREISACASERIWICPSDIDDGRKEEGFRCLLPFEVKYDLPFYGNFIVY
jgi:hypothetical protein